MNVTWLSVNASYAHVSMAFPLLERQCKDLEFLNWSLVETTLGERVSNIVEQVLDTNPDVILGTAYLFTVETVLAVCERVKLLRPEIKILLGGPEFLGDNQAFLETIVYVDAVVRGEGEAVIVSLLNGIENPDDWSNIRGVSFRDSNGFVHEDSKHAIEYPMALLPSPMDSPFFDWGRAFVQVETSRGCLSHCTFCTSAIGEGIRMLSVNRVRELLIQARLHGIEHIRILDRTFNHPEERAVELLKLFLEDFPEMQFHLEIYPNLLTQEMVDVIAQAKEGQLHIEVGIQSTKPGHLQAVKRPVFGRHSKDMLKQLCALDAVPIHVDLLAGLPAQCLEDLFFDLEVLSAYAPEEVQLETLKLLKGTPIFADLERFGIIAAKTPPYEVLCTDTMSFEDLRRVMRVSKVLDDYYGVPELRPVTRSIWKETPGFFRDFETYLHRQIEIEKPIALAKRYRFLHTYLIEQADHFAEDLELLWIKSGHSPTKGLVETCLWKECIPREAEVLVAVENSSYERDAKTYYIAQRSREVWLKIYRRSQKELIILGEWVRKHHH